MHNDYRLHPAYTQVSSEEREAHSEKIRRMAAARYQPSLIPLTRVGGMLYEQDKAAGAPRRHVTANNVGSFTYLEERDFFPLQKRFQEQGVSLSMPELDTIILRTYVPHLDFDAYTAVVGSGFDPLYTRIECVLYKICKKKTVRNKKNGRT